uniref:Uncharacterized protein n=1 Tax=Pygocentrus nattereri TaxID=42514 RepID=A0A3B4D804_PYGNA
STTVNQKIQDVLGHYEKNMFGDGKRDTLGDDERDVLGDGERDVLGDGERDMLGDYERDIRTLLKGICSQHRLCLFIVKHGLRGSVIKLNNMLISLHLSLSLFTALSLSVYISRISLKG